MTPNGGVGWGVIVVGGWRCPLLNLSSFSLFKLLLVDDEAAEAAGAAAAASRGVMWRCSQVRP